MKFTPVILSGGSGTRLWPLSRKMHPKQFLNLNSNFSMLQETIKRLSDLESNNPIIVCNEEHRFIVAEQMRQINVKQPHILLEPVGRNTAPAIALAAHFQLQNNSANDSILLVLSADHLIAETDRFIASIKIALNAALKNSLVTFGIVAKTPETGYGYIKYEKADAVGSCTVTKFVEKPNLKTAQEYIASGDYLWNSGMFIFSAQLYLSELEQHQPDMLKAVLGSMQEMRIDNDFIRLDEDKFKQCPSLSVDYAIMEKSDKVRVVPLDSGWDDIGSWSSLWSVSEKDSNGNSVKGDTLVSDSTNNFIFSESRLVAALGVENLVIVETKDAVLVSTKEKSQDVKNIVEQIKNKNRNEADFHRVVYRPWGCFDSIEEGERFKVKRITVKPGAKLSLQMHHHRAEHWVVVSGTAKVKRGEEQLMLTENESIYIHVGEKHSLENPGIVPLEIIEIQTGSYLGEDDIVRFEDKYGRN